MKNDRNSEPISAWSGLLFLLLFVMFLGPLRAHDLWWHLQAGGVILRDMVVPRFDVFSFTAAGEPWIYHSWLGGVILRIMYECSGFLGLIILRAMVFTLSLALVGIAARSRNVNRGLVAILLLACAFQLQTRALMRPYAFSFLFFAFFYYQLQTVFQSSMPDGASKWWFMWGEGGRLLILPAIMVIWANVHGGFHVGLLLFCAYGVAEVIRVVVQADGYRVHAILFGCPGARFRAYLWTGVIALSATLFNPYGAAVLTYPIRLFREVSYMSRILEWQPVVFDLRYAVFWGMAGVLGICFLRSFLLIRRREDAPTHLVQLLVDFMVTGGFFLLALRSVRNISWLLLVMPPILGYHFGITRHVGIRRPKDQDHRALYRWLACATAGILFLWYVGQVEIRAVEETFPENAVQNMTDNAVPGPTYNVYEWGGYLIWRRWPNHRVFIDGRALMYGDEVMGQSFLVANGEEGWQDVLEEYDVRSLLLRYDKYESTHFFEEGQWECVYWDDTAVVAVKAGTVQRLRRYDLTNPVAFPEAMKESPPGDILDELDAVLSANPTSWRAWMFRAEVLHKQMEEDYQGNRGMAVSARQAARRAVELSRGAEEARKVLEEVEQAISIESAREKGRGN